jgi:hypothetical protein
MCAFYISPLTVLRSTLLIMVVSGVLKKLKKKSRVIPKKAMKTQRRNRGIVLLFL